jgi:hypothetical protein
MRPPGHPNPGDANRPAPPRKLKPGDYVAPWVKGDAFNCPYCHAYAKQEWTVMTVGVGSGSYRVDERFRVSYCARCDAGTIWFRDTIVFPEHGYSEPPNTDLPAEIQHDYTEAALILSKSPRGAAALLRLCIQKLCRHLEQPGENINADIKALVAAGLPPKVQEALDSVRVIGNDAVHPGELDLRDDRETATKLFKLVNFIATKMISEPNEIDEIYKTLPTSKREAIDHRDGRGKA